VTSLQGVVAITASRNHSVAAKSDGTVWAWGDNSAGQVADATQSAAATPVKIGVVNGVKSIASGWEHVLALDVNGKVWAWGRNLQGQLGIGSTNDTSTPIQLTTLSNVKTIAAGYNHSVALAMDGTMWSWGANGSSQHGDGGIDTRLSPQLVTGMTGALAVAAGNQTTLIMRSDGSLLGAGDNWLGQLGDGSFVKGSRFGVVQNPTARTPFDLATDRVKEVLAADKEPKVYMLSEKSGDEALSSLGNLSSMSLAANVALPTTDTRSVMPRATGTTYELYVVIFMPSGKAGLDATGKAAAAVNVDTLYVKRSDKSWGAYTGGTLLPYLSGVSANTLDLVRADILDSTDLSAMSGAQLIIGYGKSSDEMLAAGRYRVMYSVP
jgi:alpha-tubulin suppressor-like RCC1 family protein